MCGITGIYSTSNLGQDPVKDVNRAVMALYRRGPDCQQVKHLGKCILGHARLSIIDLSTNASQPLTDASERYTIAFNGEFFNYKEHRIRLLEKGYRFLTNSDTEVFLALYITYGEKCLSMINGFFAVAIYDSLHQTLLVARDRYGEKPLYFYQSNGELYFASELKSLLSYPIPRQIDRSSLFGYFVHNYVPGNDSIIENVKKLPPGGKIKASPQGITIENWYEIPGWLAEKTSPQEASQQLYSLLDDAVKLRLESDVRLGCFLSGGVDSSIIAYLAKQHKSNLMTFNIGFPDQPYFDESRFAQEVSKHIGTQHTTFGIGNHALLETVYDVLEYIDEPFADSSAIPVNILSRETRKLVTVALSGDGADELFGGYRKHLAHARAIRFQPYRNALALLTPFLKLFPKSRNSFFSDKVRQLEKFITGLSLSADKRYQRWASISSPEEVSKLLLPPINSQSYLKFINELTLPLTKHETIGNINAADLILVLPGDMLPKVDRMSMSRSLEVRLPFLDYRVVEFSMKLPDYLKINRNQRKWILQQAFGKFLPSEVFTRPKKGFEVPLAYWLKHDLNHLINGENFSKDFIESQELFSYSAIDSLKKQLQSSQLGDTPAKLWALIVFQHWYKKYNPHL